MGNALEKTTGGQEAASQLSDTINSCAQASSSARLDEPASNKDIPYKRYYPRSVHNNSHFPHRQNASPSSTNTTTTAEFFRRSFPLFEQTSPLRKRLRSNAAEETLSLPAAGGIALWSTSNQSPCKINENSSKKSTMSDISSSNFLSSISQGDAIEDDELDSVQFGAKKLIRGDRIKKFDTRNKKSDQIKKSRDHGQVSESSKCRDQSIFHNDATQLNPKRMYGTSDWRNQKSSGTSNQRDQPTFHSSHNQSANCEIINEDESIKCDSSLTTDGLGSNPSGEGGPIIKAVMNRGLKARFKSFSAWLLSEPNKAPFPNSSSFPSGFGGSLKRWSSLRTSFKPVASLKLRKEASQRSSQSLAKSRTEESAVGQSSAGSLNSLSDGRTPWPVPWLEAIFLPEFPSKGAINEKSFITLGTIAKGAFGKVFRVSLKTNQEKIFAMKVQHKSDIITQNAMQQVKDEVSIHQTFANYPFVAQLYCTWQSRSKLYIVLQYVAGYGDLYQLWRDEGPFNEDAVKIWGAELAMAIDYMHASGVIYRDLKMENIMLDDDGHVQLVDFGLAKWLYYGDRTSTICGTLQYMAPEVLQGEKYNHAVDWWSLGVLLHTLLSGAYPYSGANHHAAVKIDDYIPPTSLSADAQLLLNKLLRKDPNWRLRSFTVYKTQPFFKGISFDAIRGKMVHPFDYIPKMRRCNTCNVVNEDLEGLEESDLTMFEEGYDALKNFDSFCGEEKTVKF